MLVALAAASLMVGKYPLSMDKLLAGNELQWRVFVTLRLSRTIVGLVGGFALGVAGFVYQTVKPMKRGMEEQEQKGVTVPRRAAMMFAPSP